MLTDEELRYLDTRIIQAARTKLHMRNLFAIQRLPDAGVKTWRQFVMTDMAQAVIDMDGQTESMDRNEFTPKDAQVPTIHKEFTLFWRDVIASRRNGLNIDTIQAENAAIQILEEEEKLLLVGEYTGWKALGIEGLLTATGNGGGATVGSWVAATNYNIISDVGAAIAALQNAGFMGPYAGIFRSAQYAKMLAPLKDGAGSLVIEKIKELLDQVLVSDYLVSAAGATTSALVVEPGIENFVLGIGQDITRFSQQLPNMNTYVKIYEVVTPYIKRPESIYEITGITLT